MPFQDAFDMIIIIIIIAIVHLFNVDKKVSPYLEAH